MNKTARKSIRSILLAMIITMLMLPGLCLTAFGQAPPPANSGSGTATPPKSEVTVTADDLLYQFNYKGTTEEQMAGTKIGAVNALPRATWTKTLAEVIKMLLNITGGLALLAFTVGGTMMVLSSGNGDLLEKGKKITITAIAGLVIIAVSYALVIGVSELQLLAPGSGTGAGEQAPAATPNSESNVAGGAGSS